jgi:AcrR family transcriptional regulator
MDRPRIVAKAIPLLARHGLEGITYQMVADRCGVSQSLIIYYFPTKYLLVEAAVHEVIAGVQARVAAAVQPQDDALTRLRKHFRLHLHWAVENPEHARILLLLYYLASFQKDFAELYAVVLEKARARIAEFLFAGVREKLFRIEVETEQAARLLHDALLGGILNAITIGGKPDAEEVERKWEFLIRQVASGGE